MMRRVEIDDAILLHTSQSWKRSRLLSLKWLTRGGIVFSDLEDDFVVVAQHIENLVGEGARAISKCRVKANHIFSNNNA